MPEMQPAAGANRARDGDTAEECAFIAKAPAILPSLPLHAAKDWMSGMDTGTGIVVGLQGNPAGGFLPLGCRGVGICREVFSMPRGSLPEKEQRQRGGGERAS